MEMGESQIPQAGSISAALHCTNKSSRDLVKRLTCFGRSRVGLRHCIFNQLLGDAAAADLWTTHTLSIQTREDITSSFLPSA